jgi:hypothetical protein
MTSLRKTIFLSVLMLMSLSQTAAEAAEAARGIRPTAVATEFQWREALACAAVAMLVIARLHEPRYPRFYYVSLVCACICTIYGFTSGAWPLGFAMGAYAIRILTMRPRRNIRRVYDNPEFPSRESLRWEEPTRVVRLFGKS